jgi:archaeosine-15-forming tRNA-guanine transglycosylase
MKSLAAVLALLLVTVGAVNAGEIVITAKASDSGLVLTIGAGKFVKASVVTKPEHLKRASAPIAGEIVINPKASDRAVVLTITGGKVVKASVIAEPQPVAKPEHLKDTAAFAGTP